MDDEEAMADGTRSVEGMCGREAAALDATVLGPLERGAVPGWAGHLRPRPRVVASQIVAIEEVWNLAEGARVMPFQRRSEWRRKRLMAESPAALELRFVVHVG